MVKFSELIQELGGSGSVPSYLGVGEYRYTKEYEEMERISQEAHLLLSDKATEKKFSSFMLNLRINLLIEKLIDYSKILNQKVYLSSYSDKYGNSFLQARTSLKDAFGKTKWISAYLGSIQNFDKGDKDPIALKKGKELIREKLRAFYKL
jgi:hypothetical protein